ncbi:MAG TPA: ABC transporter permease [Candidatus Acidoferrales bacterium]|nr:ABC transporter permease [Candidatus Acidoferrales bacterium]
MNWISRFFRKSKLDNQLDSELRFHIEQQTADNVAAGMTPDEARRRALAQFGGLEYIKEEARDARGTHFLESLLQDIRFALRMLRKSPGFTIVAILTLALGIGANTAIFSIVSAVLIRGLPFSDAGRLAALFQSPTGMKGPMGWAASGPDVADWQRDNRSFSEIAASLPDGANLTGEAAPQYLLGEKVTPNYFTLLGSQASLGRTFSPDESQPTHDHEIILSYRLWRSAFGGKNIIGKAIQLDDRIFIIIGVMPATFHDPRTWMNPEAQYWIPLPHADLEKNRGEHMYAAFARLKAGVPFAQAQQEMSAIGRAEAKEFPNTNQGFGVRVSPLAQVNLETSDGGYFHSVSPEILLLQFAAAFLLLLACANVAHFMLSHFVGRQRELAMRGALGASGWRLARQMLTESVVLSMVGGAAGVLFAIWAKGALLALAPDGYLPPTANVSLDWRVLCFAFVAAALSGILFGVYPAIRTSRQDPNEQLKGTVAGFAGISSLRSVRQLLVIFELAVTFLLVVGAGLMTRSFTSLMNVNPGFNPRDFLSAGINLPAKRYAKPEQIVGFFNTARQNISALPGVEAAGFTSSPELSVNSASDIQIEGRASKRGDPWPQISVITPGFFRAAGIPLLSGRTFVPADAVGTTKVVLISQAFAHYFWLGKNPLGAHLKGDGINNWLTVVGVLGDVHQQGLAVPSRPELYFPFSAEAVQSPMYLIVRSALPHATLIPEIEKAIWTIDAQIPLSDIKTGREIVQSWTANLPYQALLLASFAIMALLIAVIGVFGAVAYNTARQTHELGIRMALGAQRGQVMSMVIREGMLLVAVGIIVGTGGALALTRFLRSQLFEIKPSDPATFLCVAALLAAVALFACYIPARRAMQVDPMVALRYE